MSESIDDLIKTVGRERAYAMALRTAKIRLEREKQARNPGGLIAFIRYFWHLVEPGRPFVEGWVIDAMCAHLEAVDRGEITRLLITVPPGAMKSLLCSVFFPLWQWGPRDKPSLRFVNFSYAAHLTQRDNDRMLLILQSPEWQQLWGERWEHIYDEHRGWIKVRKGFRLRAEGKEKIATSRTGWKFASSIGGVGTGERGDCILLDDPHNIKDDRSEVVRPETVRWVREAMSNRVNDIGVSPIIAIMQRSHEADTAGTFIDEEMGYVHLNVPMEFEPDNRCVTFVNDVEFWRDPRTEEDELMWIERFPAKEVAKMKKDVGTHAWIAQYQQRPEPRGGAIIKRDYWKPYIPKMHLGKETWPKFELVVASLDSAFTEKSENDPTGFTAWGVFQTEDGSTAALLLMAWRKWLTLNGTAPRKRKSMSWADYRAETQDKWGLMQWARWECVRLKADVLLIENKANGLDIFNEMVRLGEHDPWAPISIDPKNLDKIARVRRIEPIFQEGLVYAIPGKSYVKLAVDEAAAFPRGKFRDITDSGSQALWYLRKNGYLEHVETLRAREDRERERAGKTPRGKKPLYPT